MSLIHACYAGKECQRDSHAPSTPLPETRDFASCPVSPPRRKLHVGREGDELEEERQEFGRHGHQTKRHGVAQERVPLRVPRVRGELE